MASEAEGATIETESIRQESDGVPVDSGEVVPTCVVRPVEVLQKNRALQEEIRRVVETADGVRIRNEEMRRLCNTVIQTRQQQARNKRTARPVKASMVVSGSGGQLGSSAQMELSFWSYEGHCPKLSAESRRLKSILKHVPPSFRFSYVWTPSETRSLCYAVLSLIQEKLSQKVFDASIDDAEAPVQTLRDGIEECRRVRLDSQIALDTAKEFEIDDWQHVSDRMTEQRNQKPFTHEEAARLKAIAEAHYLSNWKAISDELGTGRHPAECLRFYRQHFNIPNRKWAEEDDAKLIQAWNEGAVHTLRLLNIEMERDFRVVMARVRLLLHERSFKKGKWDLDEDAQLLKAVLRHGTCWESVSEDTPGRSAAQCRERFVYALRPSLKRKRGAKWTSEDEHMLKLLAEQHFAKYGKVKWASLVHRFEGMSPRDLLNKWNSLMEQNGC